jgi:hypothetical protein
MRRRIGYFGQQLGDSDFLQVQSNTQKYLGFFIADILGSGAAIFTGLTVTPGTGFTLNIAKGNLYQQIAADATPVGSAGHGLPADPTVITKQGCVETALANLFSGSFVVPGSGSNFYTLEAKIADADTDMSVPPLTFTNRTTQVLTAIKGPSTSSPPAPDAGWTTIATIAIPTGASTMLSGYITNSAPFSGFAGFFSGGGFVNVSPGSPQSGFISMTGNITSAAAIVGASGSFSGTVLSTGLLTASAGINVNGTANLNAKAVIGTTAANVNPLAVNGVAGGAQTAALFKVNLQPGGTTFFSVDAAGNTNINGAIIQVAGASTNIIPAAAGKPFAVSNAANTQTGLQLSDTGDLQVAPLINSVQILSRVAPAYTPAGGQVAATQHMVQGTVTITVGATALAPNTVCTVSALINLTNAGVFASTTSYSVFCTDTATGTASPATIVYVGAQISGGFTIFVYNPNATPIATGKTIVIAFCAIGT